MNRALVTLCVALLAAIGLAPAASAQTGADLNISPKRLVLDAKSRTGTLFIFNRGDAAGTYTFELTDRVMTPDGQVRAKTELAASGEEGAAAARLKSAEPLITFTPRRVTLAPGQSQTVRVRALVAPEDTASEYHTHFTATTLPPDDAGVTIEEATAAEAAGEISIKLHALFSISVPILVRSGAPDAGARLTNVTLEKRASGPVLAFDLARTGSQSIYTSLDVRRPGDAKAAPVAMLSGVAVYSEVDTRHVELPIRTPLKAGETLSLTLKDDDQKPGVTLDAALVVVP
jgi:hypothetical protein